MTLFKNVDGKRVQMTPDEETSTRLEWGRQDRRVRSQPELTLRQTINALVDKGVLTESDLRAASKGRRQ